VTTSAFHFFDQPAALREFHRVLAPGGLVAVATLSSRQPFQVPSRWKPQHNPSATEMQTLFEDAGFAVSDQHRVPRPVWTRLISDLLTVGVKS
jgi:ubiquinone/menaquinone biosynthesis C-methylase UbiE